MPANILHDVIYESLTCT